MQFRTIFVTLLSLAVLFISACQNAPTAINESAANAKHYEFRGKVIEVDKANKKATISHDKVQGYMDAMTMPFTIKEDWVLRELAPGDIVQADLVIGSDGAAWLEKVGISKSEKDSVNQPLSSELPETRLGLEVPDVKLTNQAGKRFSLKDYRGQAVVLTFIYSRCPLPDFCILMSEHFAELDKAIKADAALMKNVRLLSITIDPQNDTPEVLRSYAQGHTGKDVKQDFAVWNLATGSAAEIKQTAEFFGLKYLPDNDQIVHSLRTAIIAPDGKVFKMYGGNKWQPADILQELKTIPAEQFLSNTPVSTKK